MEPRSIPVELQDGRTTALLYSAAAPAVRPAALVLAHGAGAPQRHPFMTGAARALCDRGLDVLTFNFLYMEQGRKVPDRMPQLVRCYRAVIDLARAEIDSARERLFIGGKSMGGRASTHVAVDDPPPPIDGIVLLGYPLHPPGRPDRLRDAHLPGVRRPMLFVQGSRDALANLTLLQGVVEKLGERATLHLLPGAGHSFPVREEMMDALERWIESVI